MTPMPLDEVAPGRPWQRAALGLFVLFLLAYLPVANVIKLYARQLPPPEGESTDDIQARGRAFDAEVPQLALDRLGDTVDRFGESSGIAQGWSLFAPRFGHQASMPAVEVAFTDGRPPTYLRSS